MQMAFKDGELFLRYLDNTQFAVIKSWNLMRWDKQNQMLRGAATADLLNRLASISKLTEPVAAERDRLNSIQDAIDTERMKEEPVPLYKFPVKANLFKHQIRAANMALITFGLIDPPKKKEKEEIGGKRWQQ